MVREKPDDQRCQHKFENGEQCSRPINGQGSWLYCSEECRTAAQEKDKEAKKERDREYSRERREADPEDDNFYHFLYYHHLTEPQLKPFFENAETLQKEYSHVDDFHEDAVEEFNDILWSLLNPPDNILSAALAAEEQTLYLLNRLKWQQEGFSNRLTNRLIGYAEELHRDSGKEVSPRAFAENSRKAKEVLELWREQREISGFIYALFVYVELNRLKFLALPHERRFLNMAHRWLTATANVCDYFINHCTGTHKQTASLLAFCVPLLKTALAFNANEPENAESSIQTLQNIANTVSDSYGTTPVTETIKFSCLIHQAQFYMYCNKIDRSYQYLNEAEQIISMSDWSSIEARLEVAYVKAGLGLASNHQNRYEDLQEYIALFHRHPFLTQYRYLQDLEKLYPKDVNPSLFEGIPIYFDSMFRRLHPFLVHI